MEANEHFFRAALELFHISGMSAREAFELKSTETSTISYGDVLRKFDFLYFFEESLATHHHFGEEPVEKSIDDIYLHSQSRLYIFESGYFLFVPASVFQKYLLKIPGLCSGEESRLIIQWQLLKGLPGTYSYKNQFGALQGLRGFV